jgi:hypothetical protein
LSIKLNKNRYLLVSETQPDLIDLAVSLSLTHSDDLEDRTALFAKCVRKFVKLLPRSISNAEDSMNFWSRRTSPKHKFEARNSKQIQMT